MNCVPYLQHEIEFRISNRRAGAPPRAGTRASALCWRVKQADGKRLPRRFDPLALVKQSDGEDCRTPQPFTARAQKRLHPLLAQTRAHKRAHAHVRAPLAHAHVAPRLSTSTRRHRRPLQAPARAHLRVRELNSTSLKRERLSLHGPARAPLHARSAGAHTRL